MKYEDYEYYFWRAGIMRNTGDKLSSDEYDKLSEEERNELLDYLMYVSRKVILEDDVIEIYEEEIEKIT